jgi:hypothetical protein
VNPSVLDPIRREASDLAIARRAMSLWTELGLEDYSATLHSTGMSYWNLVGSSLGYDAIAEMPAPQVGPYAFVGDDVRNDSVWFQGNSHEPVALVEFERYKGHSDESKLLGKMDRLLLAYHRWGQRPEALILSYWTKGLASLPDHRRLRRRVKDGFETAARETVTGSVKCRVAFFQAVLQETDDGRWRLSQLIERGVQ